MSNKRTLDANERNFARLNPELYAAIIAGSADRFFVQYLGRMMRGSVQATYTEVVVDIVTNERFYSATPHELAAQLNKKG